MSHSVKVLSLTAIAVLTATAFIGTSSAAAGSTQLCKVNTSPCPAGQAATSIHATTSARAIFLNEILDVRCDVLFQGTALGLDAPQIIHGNFTYTNCSNGCTMSEISSSTLLSVLRTGANSGTYKSLSEFRVNCFFFFNCAYSTETMEGSATGGLMALSGQKATIVEGPVCPDEAFLDMTTHSLTTQFISS